MSTVVLAALLLFPAALQAEAPGRIGARLARRLPEMRGGESVPVVVYFTDKGTDAQARARQAGPIVSPRSLKRRAMVRPPGRLTDEADLPLDPGYVASVGAVVAGLRHPLKWFNAVSALATARQIGRLLELPFVKRVDLVGRWKRRPGDEREAPVKEGRAPPAPSGLQLIDYGTSFTQVNQIHVPEVHALGIKGQEVVVGVFDNGFRLPGHEAFSAMNIIATYDFVDHKVSVVPNNPNTGFGSHGVNTLSTIGGYKPGQLVGPAFESDFILARTENDSSETPVEEDNWARAIEWADSIGVDVTSTSLGYLDYDPTGAGGPDWTWADMDGNTTLITKAADRAVGLGIVVVNSAGNSGAGDGVHNTLGAPADGDSVISAGAVNSSGVRVSFSSVGPTADGRIKPDVMAMGRDVKVASSTDPAGYGLASGTSFSCPLTAGVAALIRCANPSLTPIQVREAMRETASDPSTPDNQFGWGIANALGAANYYGIIPRAGIHGTAFEDLNGDGVMQGGEPGVEGVTIRLDGAETDSTVTNVFGNYSFDSLAAGSYTVTHASPAGSVRTYPPGGGHAVVISDIDSIVAGILFGDFRLATVRGIVYSDGNHNGTRDSGEAGVAGWAVRCTGPAEAEAATDSSGAYMLTGLGPGTYAVAESVQAGWVQTDPPNAGTRSVTVTSGADTSSFDFGNVYAPDVSFPVGDGWNLLSLPRSPEDRSTPAVYPGAVSRAFAYESGYVHLDSIPDGVGYWLRFGGDQNVLIEGDPRWEDSIDVTNGWNVVGTVSFPVPVSAVQTVPDTLARSDFFGYDGGYTTADTLAPGQGYWVKTGGAGKLFLSSPPARASAASREGKK